MGLFGVKNKIKDKENLIQRHDKEIERLIKQRDKHKADLETMKITQPLPAFEQKPGITVNVSQAMPETPGLSEEMRELKWEIVSERYIKEQLAKYHRNFVTIADKIRTIDNDLNSLRGRVDSLDHAIKYHEALLIEKKMEESVSTSTIPGKDGQSKSKDEVPGLDKPFKALDFLNEYESEKQ